MPEISTLAEVEASTLFEGESVDWQYCARQANFSHRDGCEFILHVGEPVDEDGGLAYCDSRVLEMRAFGCSEPFLEAYLEALEEGVTRVLFYA